MADNPNDIAVNRRLLDDLKNIGTPDATAALLEAVQQHEKVYGLKAYQLLGRCEINWREAS